MANQNQEPHHDGLNIIYQPEHTNVTIIFVHGLGAKSKGTWTHKRTGAFWPDWLREFEEFRNARIATFGFDSHWSFLDVFSPRNFLGIPEFAETLNERLSAIYGDDEVKTPLL